MLARLRHEQRDIAAGLVAIERLGPVASSDALVKNDRLEMILLAGIKHVGPNEGDASNAAIAHRLQCFGIVNIIPSHEREDVCVDPGLDARDRQPKKRKQRRKKARPALPPQMCA